MPCSVLLLSCLIIVVVVVVTAVGAVITVVSQLNIHRADDRGQLKHYDTLNDTPLPLGQSKNMG